MTVLRACRVSARQHTLVIVVSALPIAAQAQERLIGTHSVGIGTSVESIRFAGGGLAQAGFGGSDGARITGIDQSVLPISMAMPLGGRWRMDLTALYASGRVEYTDGNDRAESITLRGVSDVRVRATGPLTQDGLYVTLGINLPTGRTSLDVQEFAALRVLAAPALGLGSSAIGAGPSGTAGMVFTRAVAGWTTAAGASYEYRGAYQPVAAIAAGSRSADFQPGGVLRMSLAGDRTVGPHRVGLATAVDVFATDRLKATRGASFRTDTVDAASVRLGPVVSVDAQMQFAVSGLRELLTYANVRHRAAFSRDRARVTDSDGQYAEIGVRASRAFTSRLDASLTVDGRLHSGLGVDQGVSTNGVRSAGVSVGAGYRRGLLQLQPYARAQSGVLRPTGNARGGGTQSFGGASAGLVLVQRF